MTAAGRVSPAGTGPGLQVRPGFSYSAESVFFRHIRFMPSCPRASAAGAGFPRVGAIPYFAGRRRRGYVAAAFPADGRRVMCRNRTARPFVLGCLAACAGLTGCRSAGGPAATDAPRAVIDAAPADVLPAAGTAMSDGPGDVTVAEGTRPIAAEPLPAMDAPPAAGGSVTEF